MKPRINFLLLVSLLALSVPFSFLGQDDSSAWCGKVSLHFCDKIDAKGNLVHESYNFRIPPSGGYVTVVVLADKASTAGIKELLFQVCGEDEKAAGNKTVCVAPLQQSVQ